MFEIYLLIGGRDFTFLEWVVVQTCLGRACYVPKSRVLSHICATSLSKNSFPCETCKIAYWCPKLKNRSRLGNIPDLSRTCFNHLRITVRKRALGNGGLFIKTL